MKQKEHQTSKKRLQLQTVFSSPVIFGDENKLLLTITQKKKKKNR